LDGQPLETTLYSLSDAPPKPGDRREGDRHLTLFRVGSITIDGRRELCLIKNISAGGMMIRAYCAIPTGTALSVELKSGQPVTGRASWVNEQNVGVTFDEAVDVIEILSASAEGPRPRMPRIEVDCIATVRDGANVYRLPVCDISQGGLKVKGNPPLEHGCDLSVSLPGMEPQPAALRWRQDGHLGISFNRLVPLGQLVAWLQGVRDSLRAAS
jgi:PilZ domain